ncbi:glycoside hydrolase family 32 protein, partial [Glaesserella parasuis]|nr:glycoside hydrolase family 32 protein [Glaesserella parasuis]
NAEGILYGWVGLPDLMYPTDKYKWHSMLTMPRQLSVKQGKIFQQPVKEIYAQLQDKVSLSVNGITEVENLDNAYLQFNVENQPLVIRFFDNEQGQNLTFRYENG